MDVRKIDGRKIGKSIVFAINCKPVRIFLRSPHHYGTALLLTTALSAIGQFSIEAVCCAWLYAFCENIMEVIGEYMKKITPDES